MRFNLREVTSAINTIVQVRRFISIVSIYSQVSDRQVSYVSSDEQTEMRKHFMEKWKHKPQCLVGIIIEVLLVSF